MFSSPDLSRDVEVIPFILTDLKADGMGFYALIAKHAYGTSNQSGLLSLVYRERVSHRPIPEQLDRRPIRPFMEGFRPHV